MIYLFTGDDVKSRSASYEKLLKSLSSGVETFFFSRNDFDRGQIESLYSGAGLFSSKSVVVFSGVLEREETRDFILDVLPKIDKSPNDFIFMEGKLNKPILDAFKKSKAEISIFEPPKVKKEKI